jgi:subtilisin family serine protease
MSDGTSRRSVLAGVTTAVATTLGGRPVGASRATDRFVVDTGSVGAAGRSRLNAMDVVHDLREEIGYVVGGGTEGVLPSNARYAADLPIELEVPASSTRTEPSETVEETPFPLAWDKREQDLSTVHDETTGEGARIGIVDDGVLASHPDLAPNVRRDLSRSFTGDGLGPGPLSDDHGTHVAGTAAAAAGGGGVVGHAPDAEIVDLRVFGGGSASFGDIVAAVTYGASEADCDVVNLSLGTPPLLPVDKPAGEVGAADDPDGPGPITPISVAQFNILRSFVAAAGRFAVDNDCLPVAAAGNSATNLNEPVGPDDRSPDVLPAEVETYLSVGATGPIGFGWPVAGETRRVGPFEVESPTDVELPTFEPAVYTNYARDAVDVTAPGGNADRDALAAEAIDHARYDFVLSTRFTPVPPETPPSERPDAFVPTYGWKAGSSMATPQVAGLAALLASIDPDATAAEIRGRIEATARSRPVGRNGVTTAPGVRPNESADGDYSGDPGDGSGGDDDLALESRTFRGNGHVDSLRAVRSFERRRDDAGSDADDDAGEVEEIDDGNGGDSGDGEESGGVVDAVGDDD